LDVPNVVIVPIADKGATWDVFVAWQRGKIAAPVRALVHALNRNRKDPNRVNEPNE